VIEDLRNKLKNKKIIVICPKYFQYEQRIVNRLIELGSIVSYIDERPNNTSLSKLFIRLLPFLYSIKINAYYNKKIKGMIPCDIVIVINPECLTLNILNHVKTVTKASKYILYMWDSFFNKKRAKKIISFFDKVLTFDPDDANNLNIIFRPLFFCFEKRDNTKKQETIDISFVGTGHSDRAKIIKIVEEECEKLNLKYFFYLYFQTPFIYLFYKITNKSFKGIKSKYFYYKPIKYNDYIAISEISKVIIDIEHPKQRGLTMRTFEALGKGKKLITTNNAIKNYGFYNDFNILIIDRIKPIITKEFIERKYQEISEELYYKHSIDGWLEDIIS
jgi:hypothetical protein